MQEQNETGKKKQAKSILIVFPTWKGSRAYRASEPLVCAGYGCGRTIAVGELYTRHKPQTASYYYSVHAFCRDCVPFVEAKRNYEELCDEYRQSQWKQADDQEWQEKYGNCSFFGPSIRIGEAQEE